MVKFQKYRAFFIYFYFAIMSLNVGIIFSQADVSLADSLEILRIENASEQRHRENLVLNNPYVIYIDSFCIYGQVRIV